jgi:hypothetical protein
MRRIWHGVAAVVSTDSISGMTEFRQDELSIRDGTFAVQAGASNGLLDIL